jgi:2-polyprenyl-3-methyl-5-hydroxy-6-metoxy-1,4-benzoquinol methylase
VSASHERVTACSCGGSELGPPIRAFRLGETPFALRRCRRCGRMLLDPRPAAEALSSSYDDDYYGAGERKFAPAIEGVVDWFREGRARQAAELVARTRGARKGAVLDIGCGSGQFLARLVRSGYECHGTELSPESGKRASAVPGLNLVFGALAPGSFAPGAFDLISIWHVLEHLPDPDFVLRLCHGWLREGGALMVAVPNAGSWQARLFAGAWFHLDPPRHFHHFTRGSMELLLRDAGFRIESLRTLSWEQNVYGILQSALNAMGFPRDEFYEVLKQNRSVFSSPRLLLEGIVMAALALPAIVFAIVEALAGRGGTLEIVARRVEAPR